MAYWRIVICNNAGYLVMGGIPLYKATIKRVESVYTLQTEALITQEDKYVLCRCGASQNKPFCDGSHLAIHFHGEETASEKEYTARSKATTGDDITLLDDNRCAFARFCHRQNGDVWTLTEHSANPAYKKQAIEGAQACPSGRLTIVNNKGEFVEKTYTPAIYVVTDPDESVAAALYVQGIVPLVRKADGYVYEQRNRIALCRCGESRNKPFCDATHISIGFQD